MWLLYWQALSTHRHSPSPRQGCWSQVLRSLSCPRVTQRARSSIHHLHLSAVAWRLGVHAGDAVKLNLASQRQRHCSQTLPMKWGAGRGIGPPTPHFTWGAQALQCFSDSDATNKSLLGSCQETGIFQHGPNQKKRKDLEMSGHEDLTGIQPLTIMSKSRKTSRGFMKIIKANF